MDLRPRYEKHHHGVRITEDEASGGCGQNCQCVISMTDFLPDKAIDLMDEAASKAHAGKLWFNAAELEALEIKRKRDCVRCRIGAGADRLADLSRGKEKCVSRSSNEAAATVMLL